MFNLILKLSLNLTEINVNSEIITNSNSSLNLGMNRVEEFKNIMHAQL